MRLAVAAALVLFAARASAEPPAADVALAERAGACLGLGAVLAEGGEGPDTTGYHRMIERATGHDLGAVIDREAKAARVRHAPLAARVRALTDGERLAGLGAALDLARLERLVAGCRGLVADVVRRELRREGRID